MKVLLRLASIYLRWLQMRLLNRRKVLSGLLAIFLKMMKPMWHTQWRRHCLQFLNSSSRGPIRLKIWQMIMQLIRLKNMPRAVL
nr:MAG TPA: hypothetical protein [Caudoviricetes sp.]DAR22347.1 MAG TPA: hypothetical protein [Caudoviricetes sp.]